MCVYFENVASRSQLIKDRNKDRSRSKSPFRSFRWKKSPQKSPLSAVSASDDEATSVELTSGIVVLKKNASDIHWNYVCKSHAWSYNISYTDKNKHRVYLDRDLCFFLLPFRLFSNSISLDIVTDQSATEADGEILEGILNRKHEWESTTKKASNR